MKKYYDNDFIQCSMIKIILYREIYLLNIWYILIHIKKR